MWNGTARILKARPTSRNTSPTMRPIFCTADAPCAAVAMTEKSIEPVKPYMSEAP